MIKNNLQIEPFSTTSWFINHRKKRNVIQGWS